MNVNYRKLWNIMFENNMLKKDLRLKAKLSTNVMSKLGKNEHVSTESLASICAVLNCDISEIVDFESTTQPHRSLNMRKPKVIELFAGAGGLALGLEKAGFASLGLIEYDKYACETLKVNRKSWNITCVSNWYTCW